jgi:DNA-binding transcriptional LysR family regulator
MEWAMQTTIEPDLLQTFVAIADGGSFTDAAKRVHRTQSAVSMQIKRLEELLGRPVFVRDGRSVSLTRDGETLLGHARRILKAHQEALAAFVQSELQGTVRLGTVDEYAVAFLPAILARFAETHPLVHVDVVCDTTTNLLARLAENAVDFALITHGHGGDDGGIVLLREPVVWATLATHCAHRQDPVPLALFHPGCKFRQWAIDSLAKQGRAYRIAYTSVSLSGIEAALRAGLAVSALPRSNVSEGFRILDERDGFPALPSYQIALRRSEHADSPVHDCLEQHIVENFRPGASLTVAA